MNITLAPELLGFIPPRAVTPADMAVTPEPRIAARDILNACAAVAGVTIIDLKADRRTFDMVKARHIAFWLCRRFTLLSLPNIGRLSGGRDHTTVLHGCRRVERVIAARGLFIDDDIHAVARTLWAADWKGVR